MGKTAVFVLATLQQLEPVDGQVRERVMRTLALFHTLILGIGYRSVPRT